MSEKYNAVCDICGKPYHVCNSCKEITSFTPWRIIADTMEHYKIFLVLSDYNIHKDKKKAKQDLKLCDLSELDTFKENIKKAISEIMNYNDENVSDNNKEENVVVKNTVKKTQTKSVKKTKEEV